MARADRVLAAAVGVIVVAAGVAAVVATQRTPAEYDPASPAGVVQTYLEAVADQDPFAATALIAEASECTESEVTTAYRPDRFSAELLGSQVRDDSATVDVRITEGGDLLDSGWTHDEVFVLVQEDGRWKVSGVPWPLEWCQGWEGP